MTAPRHPREVSSTAAAPMSDSIDALAFGFGWLTAPAVLADAEDEWTGTTRVERLAAMIRSGQVTAPSPLGSILNEARSEWDSFAEFRHRYIESPDVPANEVHMIPERMVRAGNEPPEG